MYNIPRFKVDKHKLFKKEYIFVIVHAQTVVSGNWVGSGQHFTVSIRRRFTYIFSKFKIAYNSFDCSKKKEIKNRNVFFRNREKR